MQDYEGLAVMIHDGHTAGAPGDGGGTQLDHLYVSFLW